MEKELIEGYKKICPHCNRIIKGISKGVVQHNYEEHVRYCKYKNKKKEKEKK